jgi:hypothetical protein
MDANGPGDGDLLTSATEQRELARLRAEHPTWEIEKVFGGYQATPKGARVIRAMFLDALAEGLETIAPPKHAADDSAGR